MTPLFLRVDGKRLAHEIESAERSVCYAAPGIFDEPAEALAGVAKVLRPELITVCLDLDERVIRMGFGTLAAVEKLRDAGIEIRSVAGLRTGLLVVDESGLIFTPTALLLEPDRGRSEAPNAMRLTGEQAKEALARLSPAAKMIAVALTKDQDEKQRLSAQALEIPSEPVGDELIKRIKARLSHAPPVNFDVARQLRVYTAYLQYVELKLIGAAIQRKRITLPRSIQKLGGAKTIEGRLRTTFDLIERSGALSSKTLEEELAEIRKAYTPSLGREHGRVILKTFKPRFEERLNELQAKIVVHQATVQANLQEKLDDSKKDVVEYYVNFVKDNPPDAMRGQFLECGEREAREWLTGELERVFPRASELLQGIQLEWCYKDVTFETLNSMGFLEKLKGAYPREDWDSAHEEFQAVGAAE